MNFKKEFLKDTFMSISTVIVLNLKAFILMPLIIKSVGINIYGGVFLLQSFTGFIFGMSSLGMGIRMKRFLSIGRINATPP